MPPLFKLIQKEGNIPDSEMRRVFNVGLGMIVIASPDHVEMVMNSSTSFMKVGTVIEQTGDDRVVFQS
jgi:phosphoribosylformylglycinamidine cyclo-ligase